MTLDAVARAVDLPRTSIYRLWTHADAFRVELVNHLLSGGGSQFVENSCPGWPDDDVSGAAFHSQAVSWLDQLQIDALASARFMLRNALVGCVPQSPPAPGFIGQEVARIEAIAQRVEQACRATGRSIVAPLQPLDLAVLFFAALDSIALVARFLPELNDARWQLSDGSRHLPLTFCIVSLFIALTEPSQTPAARGPRPSPIDAASFQPTTDRRAVFLEAGAEVLTGAFPPSSHESPAVRGTGTLTLASFARRIGVTERALRRHWPSDQEFEAAVLERILEFDFQSGVETMTRVVDIARTKGVDPLLACGESMFRLITRRPTLRRQRFVITGPPGEVAVITDQLRTYVDELTALLEAGLDEHQARVRPGLSSRDLVTVAILAADGIGRLARLHPQLVRRDIQLNGSEWSIVAIAAKALITSGLTRGRTPVTPRMARGAEPAVGVEDEGAVRPRRDEPLGRRALDR